MAAREVVKDLAVHVVLLDAHEVVEHVRQEEEPARLALRHCGHAPGPQPKRAQGRCAVGRGHAVVPIAARPVEAAVLLLPRVAAAPRVRRLGVVLVVGAVEEPQQVAVLRLQRRNLRRTGTSTGTGTGK